MSILAKKWWVLVLRGVLAILFGVVAFLWPGITAAWFILLFGAYALLDGVSHLVGAFRGAPGASRLWLVVGGIVSIFAAIVVFARPALSGLFLFYLVATWAVAVGVAQIFAAIQLRRVVQGEWLLVLAGILSIAFGIFMFARPAAGLLSVVWVIAFYAVLEGILLVTVGFRLRSLWDRVQQHGDTAAASV